jgi:prevent-host-death family protein
MEFVGVLTFRQHLAKYLGEVAEGKHFVILRNNQPIARLIPYREGHMSEERARYVIPSPDGDNLSELVNLALFLAHDDQTEAARLLAQAAADLLKAERP